MSCSGRYANCVDKCKPPVQSGSGGVGENGNDDGWSEYAECMAQCIAAWYRCVDGKVPGGVKRLRKAKTNRGRLSAMKALRRIRTFPTPFAKNLSTAIRRLQKA